MSATSSDKPLQNIFPGSFKRLKGDALLGGVKVSYLASKEGTPSIIYCADTIDKNCRDYATAFKSKRFRTKVFYASKAFSTVGFCELIAKNGLGIDVSTAGELFTAITAKFPPKDIMFHGNNKSGDEIKMAAKYGIGRYVIDSLEEVGRIAAAYRGKKRAEVLIRLIPGVKASTHKYLTTGTADSKFGMMMDSKNALAAVRAIKAAPNLELKGFHFHIGSQIFDLAAYPKALSNISKWIKDNQKVIGSGPLEINIGGGLGIAYLKGDKPPAIKDYCKYLIAQSEVIFNKFDLNVATLMIEPGRSIVGRAGMTIYTVGNIKKSGDKLFISVDGGMSDNLRPALYGSKYEISNLSRTEEKRVKATIVGKHCETGDVLIEDALVARPQEGDILAVPATGAYCFAMANNYNRLGRPAVLLAGSGKYQVLVAREDLKDIIRNDKRLKHVS